MQEANSIQAVESDIKGAPSLDDLIKCGRGICFGRQSREIGSDALAVSNVKAIDGRRAVARNGYLSLGKFVGVAGSVSVQVPKVRALSGWGVKPSSVIVPPYTCVSRRACRRRGLTVFVRDPDG
ncbi:MULTISPECIES: hypothetical protein [unclassified Burkholderia]|uniref:hypothetical protein n=1 Tax=unclassified Burkholderia TaxID=2613784 RepID=UPI000752F848|nr:MULTISPECIES: hypothetical protein [unclassified Burkholderia]KVN20670.1 hypothetical protein WT08_28185 [Burkholderia sp. MSMB1552]KWZ46953.1 hypothetical protein WS92_29885 [Burkholderia sp. MSMB1588]